MSLVTLRRAPGPAGHMTRTFVREVLDPEAARTETEQAIPASVRTRMQELGYFGLTIPVEYGGVGLTLGEYLEVVRELARTNLAFEELVEENNGIGSASLLAAGTREQKQQWLPRLASGEILAAFALTEPDAGSDLSAIATRAKRVDGGFVVNGRKHFITHGADAELITVVARSEDHADGRRPGFSLMLVQCGTPGFSVARVQPMMGYRASRHAELVFDDVFVPDDSVLGEPGEGFRVVLQTLDVGRLTVVADCLGAAETLLDRTITYARDRVTFGKRLIDRGQILEMLVTAAADLFMIERELFAVAALVERGDDVRYATAGLKLTASEAAHRIADTAMQIHGGIGYTVEAGIERGYRDLRVMRIAEGASEVLRSLVARGEMQRVNPHDAPANGQNNRVTFDADSPAASPRWRMVVEGLTLANEVIARLVIWIGERQSDIATEIFAAQLGDLLTRRRLASNAFLEVDRLSATAAVRDVEDAVAVCLVAALTLAEDANRLAIDCAPPAPNVHGLVNDWRRSLTDLQRDAGSIAALIEFAGEALRQERD